MLPLAVSVEADSVVVTVEDCHYKRERRGIWTDESDRNRGRGYIGTRRGYEGRGLHEMNCYINKRRTQKLRRICTVPLPELSVVAAAVCSEHRGTKNSAIYFPVSVSLYLYLHSKSEFVAWFLYSSVLNSAVPAVVEATAAAVVDCKRSVSGRGSGYQEGKPYQSVHGGSGSESCISAGEIGCGSVCSGGNGGGRAVWQ